MIKCIFLANEKDPEETRCNITADYIFLGKSYCAKHFRFRAQEMLAKRDAVK